MSSGLARAAGSCPAVEAAVRLSEWVGEDGVPVTPGGSLRPADVTGAAAALGTDDVIDPTIGDRVYRTKSSEELLHLTLVVEWAKAARLVRRTGHRLVPVKKNQALLDDIPALWHTLFTVFDQLGEAFLPSGFGESLLHQEFPTGIRAMLTALCHADGAVGTTSLCALAWEVVTAPYVLDHATEIQLKHWRAMGERDAERALAVLRRLAAVTIENETAPVAGRAGARRPHLPGEDHLGGPGEPARVAAGAGASRHPARPTARRRPGRDGLAELPPARLSSTGRPTTACPIPNCRSATRARRG